MNSYEELAVSQPVTKMKMEVEKHIGQASAQHTPTRSRALEQKEEIFSKEIKGIIQRLEEQERLNAAEGTGSSSSSSSLSSAKSGGSGIVKEKMLGDQISFTDVSFLCKEMPKGSVLSLVKAWNSGCMWKQGSSRNLKDLTMDEWKQLAEASQRHFPSSAPPAATTKPIPNKNDAAAHGGARAEIQRTPSGHDADTLADGVNSSSDLAPTSTTDADAPSPRTPGSEEAVAAAAAHEKPAVAEEVAVTDDKGQTDVLLATPNKEATTPRDEPCAPEQTPEPQPQQPQMPEENCVSDQPEKDINEEGKSSKPAADAVEPSATANAASTDLAEVSAEVKDRDSVSAQVDAQPVVSTEPEPAVVEPSQTAASGKGTLRKSGRVVVADAAATAEPVTSESADAATTSPKGKSGSSIDSKDEARKQAHTRKRGHVRAASMSESLKSLITGSKIEPPSAAADGGATKKDKEASSPLASSASGSRGKGGSDIKPAKEKKEKKKSKWDKVRGLKGGAAKDKSETISEDVIAAAKRDRDAGSSIGAMATVAASPRKPSTTDSLRPHLMKHNSEKLDRMLVRRPSYKVLVEQGYIKEWGDEAGIDAAAVKALSPRGSGLKRSPTFKLEDEDVEENTGDQDLESDDEEERKSLIHNVQLLPTDSLWHVERGSKRDFVPGAYMAFENDHELVPYYKKFFHQREHENYWARHERLGPILISIEGKSTRGSARLLRRETHAGGRAESPSSSPVLSRENSPSSLNNIADSDAAAASASSAPSSGLSKQAKRRSAILMPRKSSIPSIKTEASKDVINKEEAPSSSPAPSSSSSSSGLLSHLSKDAFKLGGWKTKSEIFSSQGGKSGKQGNGSPLTWRVLIQTKKGAQQFFIRSGTSKSEKHRAIQIACGSQGICPELHDLKLKPIKSSSFPEDMVKLEKAFLDHDEYKFGVLYGTEGQSENEMFANVDTSPEFERFLHLLGDRITLKGWTQYAGGLDVKRDSTGTQSVFRKFRDLEIMFHVGPLLPFYPDDTQHVERKRHLGNDIVVIVFLDRGTFTPSMIKTKFNHIYAVVSVDRDEVTDEIIPSDGPGSAPRMRVEFASREGVRPYGATIPRGYHFALDDKFIDFLLTKLVNGQRAALHAPVFARKLEMTRSALMEDLMKDWA